MKAVNEICENLNNLIKIVASSPVEKTAEYAKISVRPIESKNGTLYQSESFTGTQVFHKNIAENELEQFLGQLFLSYRQIVVFYAGRTTSYFVANPSRIRKSEINNGLKKVEEKNDRQKQYILNEGDKIPALVDLGVFTTDYRIIKSKYDKFKQINRFIETIDDKLKSYDKDEITVLDFGCGKSYLTFIVRHYLVNVKKLKAKIIGYDLKKDVVNDCNEIARKYGYDDISFVVADVKKRRAFRLKNRYDNLPARL